MCLEDVQIGRHTESHLTTVALSTSSGLLVRNNAKRWQLTITPPSSGICWLMPGSAAIAGRGYVLQAGDPPLVVTVQHDGKLAILDWYALCDAGAPIVTILDVWLSEGTERAEYAQ